MTSVQHFGKYQLIERIAVGGMAEIYRAKTQGAAGFEKEVVIKRILPQFSQDDEFVKMFIDEARIASRLAHSNIVQIYDFDSVRVDDGDAYYIAMELVDGKDLRHLLKEGIKKASMMPLAQCLHIGIETLKGLHYAHTKTEGGKPLNIVHRDVSPHNILVSYSGDVKISDFGIAKAAARATATSNGMVKGKLSYMSPEQVTGQPLDGRSDIFSAGIVLYEMLTRSRLFVSDSETETIVKVRDAVVPPPRSRNPEIPVDVEAALMRLLAHNPAQRPPNANEAARMLSQTSSFGNSAGISVGEYVTQLFPPVLRRPITVAQAAPAVATAAAGGAPSIRMPAAFTPPPRPNPGPASPAGALLSDQKPNGSNPAPVAEMSTAILDGNSPEMQKVQAQIAAAQAAKQAATLPAPASVAVNSGPAPVAELSTAILDGANPEVMRIQAQIAAAQAARVNPPPVAAPPPVVVKPVAELATAILDGASPQMMQVQAQIAAAQASRASASAPPPAAAGPPPAWGPPSGGSPHPPAGGGQSTVMLDAPSPAMMAPKRPIGATSLPPIDMAPPKPPSTAMRWVIGPVIMLVAAGATAGAARFALPASMFAPTPIGEVQHSKLKISTNPSRATIMVNGTQWGKFTPTDIDAPIGSTVHIELKLDGYQTHPLDLKFQETNPSLTITLDREDPDVANPGGSHSTKVRDSSPKVGVIGIYCTGNPATVFVDSTRKRQTPIASLELTPGPHVIELVNDQIGKREKINVNIKAGVNPEIRRDWSK